MIHPPKQDESQIRTQGNPPRFRFWVGRFKSSTNVVERSVEFGSFGEVLIETVSALQPYAFNGLRLDEETGFYFSRARYLDPQTGTFIQSDPIQFQGSPYNLYEYVEGNPYVNRDPSGLAVTQPENTINNITRKQIQAETIQKIADGVENMLVDVFRADGRIKNLGTMNLSLGSVTGHTCHGNSRRSEIGIHVYQIYNIRSGITRKVGIGNNSRLLPGGRRSGRALEQQKTGEDHVVILDTPDGYMARGLGFGLERAAVNAAATVFGFDVNDLHKRPAPDPNRCSLNR